MMTAPIVAPILMGTAHVAGCGLGIRPVPLPRGHAQASAEESLGASALYAATHNTEADNSLPATIEVCIYLILGDNPHLSSTGTEVSAHGRRDIHEGPCPEEAQVTAVLYAQRCAGAICW